MAIFDGPLSRFLDTQLGMKLISEEWRVQSSTEITFHSLSTEISAREAEAYVRKRRKRFGNLLLYSFVCAIAQEQISRAPSIFESFVY